MKGLVITSCCLVLLGYFLYEPLPPELKQHTKTRLLLAPIKITGVLSIFVKLFGYDPLQFHRAAGNVTMLNFRKTPPLQDKVDSHVIMVEDVPVRLYELKEKSEGLRPGLIVFHGGGWAMGESKITDPETIRLVVEIGAVALSVDYRLAPEFPFPTPLADCVKVTKFILLQAESFGVDASRVMLYGTSAGGHMAVSVSMKLKSEAFPLMPKLQVALFPPFQAADLSTPSYLANKDGPMQTKSLMAFFYSLYAVGNLSLVKDMNANQHVPCNVLEKLRSQHMQVPLLPDDDIKRVHTPPNCPETVPYWDDIKDIIMDPYFSPLFAPDDLLEDLPETYINACQFDVLRDEGLWMAERLKRLKVTVHVDLLPCMHCWSLFLDDLESAEDAMLSLLAYLKERL